MNGLTRHMGHSRKTTLIDMAHGTWRQTRGSEWSALHRWLIPMKSWNGNLSISSLETLSQFYISATIPIPKFDNVSCIKNCWTCMGRRHSAPIWRSGADQNPNSWMISSSYKMPLINHNRRPFYWAWIVCVTGVIDQNWIMVIIKWECPWGKSSQCFKSSSSHTDQAEN